MLINNIQLHGKQLLRSLLFYAFGVFIIPLGVVFTINSKLGAGGYDALTFALSEVLGFKTSYAVYGTGIIVVIITAIIRKGFPRTGTLFASFFMGLSTDFWKKILADVNGDTWITSILVLLVGIVIVAFGVAVYMASMLPTCPPDDLVMALKEKGIAIRVSKISWDLFCVIIAFILGGEIGIGTIIVTFALGPIVQTFYGIITKIAKI